MLDASELRLPLRGSDGRYLVAETDQDRRVALISLPALGGLRVRSRSYRFARSLVSDLVDLDADATDRVTLARVTGRARLLLGMVLANRPWLLVPGLKSALVAALATGAIATINSTVWLLATSLAPWRLAVATVASMALSCSRGSSPRRRRWVAASAPGWSPMRPFALPPTPSARRNVASGWLAATRRRSVEPHGSPRGRPGGHQVAGQPRGARRGRRPVAHVAVESDGPIASLPTVHVDGSGDASASGGSSGEFIC